MLLKGLRKKNKSINQINVTPFVDVMLVLLIVFMITAPLLTVGVSVDLPKTKAAQLNQKGDPIVVSIKKTGDFVYLITNLRKWEKENIEFSLTQA